MAQRPQLSIVNYRKGMYITLEGNRDSDRFFIIQSGKVQLSKRGEAFLQESNGILGPGDFFGVISSMAQKSQIETAQAISDVTLVATNRNQFEGLIQFNTPIAMKIIQQFSRRMRFLNNIFTNLTLHSVNTIDDSTSLFAFAEHYLKQKNYRLAIYAYKRYLQCCPQGAFAAQAGQRAVSLVQHDKQNYSNGDTPFVRHYTDGAPVFVEGETGDELFIVQGGSVKIIKVINEDEVILAKLKSGDIFGEMALLESKPRSASAITSGNTTLMVIQKQNFEKMTETQPQVISHLTQILAERIWFSYKQLENAAIKDLAGRCFDYMMIYLERANFQIQPKRSYTFSFGPEELVKMAAIPENETKRITRELLQNNNISVLTDGKLFITDVSELSKQNDFFKKAQIRGGVRK
jgi:CRP-like cAMP-binding protein